VSCPLGLVILARAGSKGVPGKNIAPVAGRPCIAWTIDHALRAQRAGAVGPVAVSTDGPAIARVARELGVPVLSRSPDLAADHATVDDAAREALAQLEAEHGPLGGLVILYANVPVRPVGLIERAAELLVSSGCDSVQSYAPVGKHHPWWMARVGADGQVAPWDGPVLNHGVYRRQDLPACHLPDGGVLVVSRRALLLDCPGAAPGPHQFFGVDRRGVLTSEGEVVDIDAPIDLLVADAILRARVPAVCQPGPAPQPASLATI
jgi:CMP-N,N'-diacetyllegionaminic acid synthase